MNHYDRAQWSLYRQGELPLDMEQLMEDHLYTCDLCLDTYLQEIDTLVQDFPLPIPLPLLLPVPINSAKPVMLTKPAKPNNPYKRTLRNYMIASAATLLLVITGVFHGLLDLPEVTAKQSDSSLSEKFLDSTVSMIDTLASKEAHTKPKEDHQ